MKTGCARSGRRNSIPLDLAHFHVAETIYPLDCFIFITSGTHTGVYFIVSRYSKHLWLRNSEFDRFVAYCEIGSFDPVCKIQSHSNRNDSMWKSFSVETTTGYVL